MLSGSPLETAERDSGGRSEGECPASDRLEVEPDRASEVRLSGFFEPPLTTQRSVETSLKLSPPI